MEKASKKAVLDVPPPYSDVDGTEPPAYVKNEPATHAKQTELPSVIETRPSRKWCQRKRVWIMLAVVLLTVIGLVVGLAVGLAADRHKPDKPSSNSSDSDNSSRVNRTLICSGFICPQVITTASFDGRLHIFIRTADNRIAHNSGGRGKSPFEFQTTWSDLGETTGKLISQPAAVAWKREGTPRLSIFALSSSSNTVYGRFLQGSVWSDWKEVGANAGSQPVLCRTGDDDDERIDLWVTDADSHEVMQQSWDINADTWAVDDGFADTNGTGPARTAPAVVCRDDNVKHDVVWYGREDGGALWHRGYNSKSREWEEARGFGGHFVGDPALFMHEKRPRRIDFFGVQDNHEVYHFNQIEGEYSELQALGGNVTSTPSVVGSVSALTDTFDVVALGRDGDVRHLHYNGETWSKKWENIHLPAIGAPTIAMYGKYTIVLLLLREDGIYFSTVGDSTENWIGRMITSPIGGNPSLKFFADKS